MVRSVAITALLIIFLAAACGKEETRHDHPNIGATSGVTPANPVPTRLTDSSNARCVSEPRVWCYADTARMRELDFEPGEVLESNWLVFVAAGDSIDIRATGIERISYGAEMRLQPGRDSMVRGTRLVAIKSGVVAVTPAWMDMGEADTVPFTLRVARSGGPTRGFNPTGKAATLTIESSRPAEPFSIVPVSLLPHVRNAKHWAVQARRYKVALLEDAAYVICGLPCLLPDTVTLTPGAVVLRRY